MALTMLDYALLFAIGFFTVMGGLRGLVRQVFDLASWVLSLYFGFMFGPVLAREADRYFGLVAYLNASLGPLFGDFAVGEPAANVLGFIAVLIIVKLLVELAASLADLVARLPVISTFNRIGGLLFGFAKGVTIVFVIAVLLTAVSWGVLAQVVDRSWVITTILEFSPTLTGHLRDILAEIRP